MQAKLVSQWRILVKSLRGAAKIASNARIFPYRYRHRCGHINALAAILDTRQCGVGNVNRP
ncbi:hypothetical protein BAR1_14305 [Profundibacter amoris]|uniref:Uncharacterized protein n=1 Tax=Profundibacter amoris TaxID=2171755 RepID=A0A347UJG9_9RHOB|nr:hypothetical protein BAR1_14305 [Profundibacter amoris]